jgi:protein CMS1
MAASDEDQTGVPLFEGFSDPESPAPSAKRKRDAEEKQSAKRRKLKKPKDVDDSALDVEAGVNLAIAHMDTRLLADHVAQRTKRFRPDLSLVENEDIHIPGESSFMRIPADRMPLTYNLESAIIDTTIWSKPRTKDRLAGFLEQFAKTRRKKKGQTLSNAPTEKGHPHTLVIAGSALRAADLVRDLRKFQTKEALIAKLFAKHIKLKEAVETVKNARINIGVGTPQRIMDLLENGTSLHRSCSLSSD